MNVNCLILLATYNGEKYVQEQLNSILNQEGVTVKIVVSDDNSSDNTLQVISSLKDSRIEILPSSESFGSASQNFFRLIRDVALDDFDFVAFADQDDIWYSDKLFRAVSVLSQNNIDAYSSNVLAFWEDGTKKLIDKAGQQKENDFLFGSSGPGCTCVFTKKFMINFKREIILRRALTKKIDLHDWLLYAYARSNNYDWFTDSNPSMLYRQHSNNVFGANSGIKTYLVRWNKSRNGWYRKQILFTADFCGINTDYIKLLRKNNYLDRLKLSANVLNFRKKTADAFFLALILIVPGFK